MMGVGDFYECISMLREDSDGIWRMRAFDAGINDLPSVCSTKAVCENDEMAAMTFFMSLNCNLQFCDTSTQRMRNSEVPHQH